MSPPAGGTASFLELDAGGFSFLLPAAKMLQIVQVAGVRAPHEGAPTGHAARRGEVQLPDGRRLELVSLSALAGRPAPLGPLPLDAVEVECSGRRILLEADRVGAIEDLPGGECWQIPALLFAGGRPWCPRAWPTATGLRWEIDPEAVAL